MFAISATAVSGMNAAQSRLQTSAQSIARLATQGPDSPAPSASASPATAAPAASLETDLVGLLQAKNSFLANLAVFRTSDQLTRTLLDVAG